MEAIKLSIVALIFKWSTFCVDWFMDFFAEPENYWVAETYPSDAPVMVEATAINPRMKSVLKLSEWLKQSFQNPFTIAQSQFKLVILNLYQASTTAFCDLMAILLLVVHKDTRPIIV